MPEHDENARRHERLVLLDELMVKYDPARKFEVAPSTDGCGQGVCRTCGADEVP